jgi:excisionase family DNA binding protein
MHQSDVPDTKELRQMTDATTAEPPASGRLLYKVRDVARLLSLGESKVWELVARGEIESVKIDGARRVRPGAVEAYVERLSAGGGARAT